MKLKQQTDIDNKFVDSVDYEILTSKGKINDIYSWVNYIQIYKR
jgi:hypothetical protein